MSSPYPTLEDELRAKEAKAEETARAEQSRFLASFQTIPKKNGQMLDQLSTAIVQDFNSLIERTRKEPYDRQENLMAGLKRLYHEEINLIEARLEYAEKLAGAARQGSD